MRKTPPGEFKPGARFAFIKNETRISEGTESWTVLDRRGLPAVVNVWRSADGTCRCVECSGPLVAMSSSCAHAKALKRHCASTATAGVQEKRNG